MATLTDLVAPVTGGDPMTKAKYLRGSLQTLSDQLEDRGQKACPTTVGKVLREMDYDLYGNVKRFTGPAPPDRDPQFQYLAALVAAFRDAGLPILSVDPNKKELIGNFAHAGTTWRQEADAVNVHDFLSEAQYRVVPYGLYDVLANQGHVLVGTSAATPQFAAEAVARWWARIGCHRYRDAGALLVLADSGGSNGCRPRLWKWGLQEWVADRYGLDVTGCHSPTGAAKWNPVAQRLCGPLSVNWAGVPLRTPAMRLGCLRGTPTTTGLRVSAEGWERTYSTGVQVPATEMQELALEPHDLCPRWNYTIHPRAPHPGH